MTHCNTLNCNLSNSQFNKFKTEMKKGIQVTLKLLSNLVGDSNNETDFSHKLLLTDTQVSRICKVLANGWSANMKFSKSSWVF